MKTLVIHHGNCYDGTAAAWVTRQAFPDCRLHPAIYGKVELPPMDGDEHVILVDFTYPQETMLWLAQHSASLTVLDHHKTAEAALDGFAKECADRGFCPVTILFDMKRSGCELAWNFYFPTIEPPPVLLHIADRDLWRFRYADTAAVHAFMATREMTVEDFGLVMGMPFEEVVEQGKVIARYIERWCEKAAKEAYLAIIDGRMVAAINVPYQNASELANYLLDRHGGINGVGGVDYAMGYFRRADGLWQYSLRSKVPFDVSEVAVRHGGGGHAQAAGFTTSELLEELR